MGKVSSGNYVSYKGYNRSVNKGRLVGDPRVCRVCGDTRPYEDMKGKYDSDGGWVAENMCKLCDAKGHSKKRKPVPTPFVFTPCSLESVNLLPEEKICAKCGIRKEIDYFTNKYGKVFDVCSNCFHKRLKLKEPIREVGFASYPLVEGDCSSNPVVAYVQSFKRNRGCAMCGERNFNMLDIHHTDPSLKTVSVSEMIRRKYPFWEVVEECEKPTSQVLCKNCHSDFTIKQMQNRSKRYE